MYLARRMRPDEDPDFYLGAALPQFFDMYRYASGEVVSQTPFNEIAPLAAGMRLGREAYTAQRRNPLYNDLVRLAATDLISFGGLEPRQAPASAAAVVDLVIDGVISQRDGSRAQMVIDEVDKHLKENTSALAKVEVPEHFFDFVENYFADKNWRRYRSALGIAQILQLRAETRPFANPAINEKMIPGLTEAVHMQMVRLNKWGWQVLDYTFAAVEGRIKL